MAKRMDQAGLKAKVDKLVEAGKIDGRVDIESLRWLDPEDTELFANEPELLTYKNKQVVIRTCPMCEEDFTIATSDLHQKDHCNDCAQIVRKERAKAKRAAEREIIKAADSKVEERLAKLFGDVEVISVE